MSIRAIILVIALLLVTGFVALNLDEVFRPTTLNFAFTDVQAPLGLVLLGMLAVLLVIFLVLIVFTQTSHLIEVRKISREAAEQRKLADQAEASRFTGLKEYLQSELTAMEGRQKTRSDAAEQQLGRIQAELSRQLEQTGNSLSASLGEMEDRLERQDRIQKDSGA
ncbi:MAG: LapA family protein [Burkholderiaceae bacterium]